MKRIIGILTILLFAISCEDELEPSLPMYGSWNLYEISGGFGGVGDDMDFDFIKFGMEHHYLIFKDTGWIEWGGIMKYSKIEEGVYKFAFEPEFSVDGFTSISYLNPKTVLFDGGDTLTIMDPGADTYVYKFKRK